MDESKIVTVIIDGFIIPVFVCQNLLSIIIDGLTVKRLSKYNGYLIKEKNTFPKRYNYGCNLELTVFMDKVLKYVDLETRKFLKMNTVRISTVAIPHSYNKNVEDPLAFYRTPEYNVIKNTIFYKEEKDLCLNLLTALSTNYLEEDDIILSGFMQRDRIVTIGKTFNDTYTKLLTSRIFPDINLPSDKNLTKIVERVENSFENKKDMEHLYFRHDLPALIKHLEGFMPREKAINFLLDMDMYLLNRSILNPVYIIDKNNLNKVSKYIKKKDR